MLLSWGIVDRWAGIGLSLLVSNSLPVEHEQALFASKDLQHVAFGGQAGFHGIALELQPQDAVPYTLPPGWQPKIAKSSSGLVVISCVPKAEPCQITASAEGWVDIIQDGRRDCSDVRKSLRFDPQSGAATIQVTSSSLYRINASIARSTWSRKLRLSRSFRPGSS